MKNINEYYRLAGNILTNDYFLELKKDNHHGTNKYDHCKRVSYISFLLAKILKANKREVVRAGLLHDFFFGERTEKEENSYLKHPKTSAINAKKYFNITEKEAKDIETHMFHHVLVKKVLPFVNYKEKAKIKKENTIMTFLPADSSESQTNNAPVSSVISITCLIVKINPLYIDYSLKIWYNIMRGKIFVP